MANLPRITKMAIEEGVEPRTTLSLSGRENIRKRAGRQTGKEGVLLLHQLPV